LPPTHEGESIRPHTRPILCHRGADLRKASLQRANLRNADFDGAEVEGASFKGALGYVPSKESERSPRIRR
jgi:hypothetical protein